MDKAALVYVIFYFGWVAVVAAMCCWEKSHQRTHEEWQALWGKMQEKMKANEN